MNSIIFVRHGQSQANADKMIAVADSPLTELGRAQAKATAEQLKHEHVTAIACSPYIRARQTADILATELGIGAANIHIIDELHERGFGQKEGGPKEHESFWYYTVNDEYDIESQQALIERSRQALKEIKTLAEQQNGTLVVVGHATAGFYLRQVAGGRQTFAEFSLPEELPNANYVRLEL